MTVVSPEHLDLIERLAAHANTAPDNIVVRTDDTTISADVLVERVGRIANGLLDRGVGPGAVVGMVATDPIDHVVIALALLCSGAKQLCLSSYETDLTNRSLAEKAGVTLIVARGHEAWMDGLSVVDPTDLAEAAYPSRLPPVATKTMAVLRRTSGSTGVPRLLQMSLERILMRVDRMAASQAQRCVLHTRPIEFDQTAFFGFGAALAGNSVIFTSDGSLDTIAEYLSRHHVSCAYLSSYNIRSMLQALGTSQSPLSPEPEMSVHGSRVPGPLRAEIQRRLTANFVVRYGASEVGSISIARPEEHALFPEGVGFPNQDITVEIVDDEDQPLPDGEAGHARIRTPGMADGYIGDSTATALRFRDGWFYSGDILTREPGGPLTFRGRSDDVINLNGIKIEPAAIEDVLAAHPDILDVAVFSIESSVHGAIPAAAIMLDHQAISTDPEDYIEFCRAQLGVRGPRRIVVVDRIPRNTAGKFARGAFNSN